MPSRNQLLRVFDELGIGCISARSLQANRRVERLWRTFQ